MRLDPAAIADLAVAFRPEAYIRVSRIAHARTPLGMGHGASRFASPSGAFQVLYIADTLTTSVAETLVRDRFQARARRNLAENELGRWGVASVSATRPLRLIDLRTTGLVRIGVSTDAARGKAQAQGRKLSEAIYELTDAEGILYLSRLTGGTCVCVFDRAVPNLTAARVDPLILRPDLIPALAALNVSVTPASAT